MKFHYNEHYFVTCTNALYLYFMGATGLHGVITHKTHLSKAKVMGIGIWSWRRTAGSPDMSVSTYHTTWFNILRQQWMKSTSMSRKVLYLTREATDSLTTVGTEAGIPMTIQHLIMDSLPPPPFQVSKMWNLPDNQSTSTQIEWTIYVKLRFNTKRIG